MKFITLLIIISFMVNCTEKDENKRYNSPDEIGFFGFKSKMSSEEIDSIVSKKFNGVKSNINHPNYNVYYLKNLNEMNIGMIIAGFENNKLNFVGLKFFPLEENWAAPDFIRSNVEYLESIYGDFKIISWGDKSFFSLDLNNISTSYFRDFSNSLSNRMSLISYNADINTIDYFCSEDKKEYLKSEGLSYLDSVLLTYHGKIKKTVSYRNQLLTRINRNGFSDSLSAIKWDVGKEETIDRIKKSNPTAEFNDKGNAIEIVNLSLYGFNVDTTKIFFEDDKIRLIEIILANYKDSQIGNIIDWHINKLGRPTYEYCSKSWDYLWQIMKPEHTIYANIPFNIHKSHFKCYYYIDWYRPSKQDK